MAAITQAFTVSRVARMLVSIRRVPRGVAEPAMFNGDGTSLRTLACQSLRRV
jgi:hypothetical protein